MGWTWNVVDAYGCLDCGKAEAVLGLREDPSYKHVT